MAPQSQPLTGNEIPFAIVTFLWALCVFGALWKMTIGRLK